MLELSYQNKLIECGTDEAGRGCMCGPVTAAAVILPKDFSHPLLNDSKKLSEKKRLLLKPIIEKEALAFAVVHVFPEEIDKINILNASILAMHRAIEKLDVTPEFISVDGNKFHPYLDVPHKTIIKGDGKFLNIAAASVLAKTYRDAYMLEIDKEFPVYQWKKNKGYPTAHHRAVITNKGITKYHRKSFKLKADQLTLNL